MVRSLWAPHNFSYATALIFIYSYTVPTRELGIIMINPIVQQKILYVPNSPYV